jgi:hypothetical protein
MTIERVELVYDDGIVTSFEPCWLHPRLLIPSTHVHLTAEDKARYDREYSDLKHNLQAHSIGINAIGTVSTALTLGPDKGLAFAIGGAIAVVYMAMLQQQVDGIGTRTIVLNGAARMTTLSFIIGSVLSVYSDAIHKDSSYYIIGLLGFMCYKLALWRKII